MAPSLILVSLGILVTSMSFVGVSIADDDLRHQGRWVYSESPTKEGRNSWVAMTPAEETNEVWLSFSCSNDPQILASIFDF